MKRHISLSHILTQMADGINNPLKTSSKTINPSSSVCLLFHMCTLLRIRKKPLILIPSFV